MSLQRRVLVGQAVACAAAAVLLTAGILAGLRAVTGRGVILAVALAAALTVTAAALAAGVGLLRPAARALVETGLALRALDPQAPDGAARLPEQPGDPGHLTAGYNALVRRLRSDRVAISRRAVTAQEEERAAIAVVLHDQVGQHLTSALLRLRLLADNAPDTAEPVTEIADLTRAALAEVRGLSSRLRPGALADLGLRPALLTLAREVGEQGGLRVDLDVERTPEDADSDPEVDLAVYRVAQEALANAARHSGARRVRSGSPGPRTGCPSSSATTATA